MAPWKEGVGRLVGISLIQGLSWFWWVYPLSCFLEAKAFVFRATVSNDWCGRN